MQFFTRFLEWLATFESHSHRQFAESMILRDIKDCRRD